MWGFKSFVTVASFVSLLLFANGSPGDRLQEFEDCLYQCEETRCYLNPYHITQQEFHEQLLTLEGYEFRRYTPQWHFDSSPSLPWHLWVLGWNCILNCNYECQRIITRERIEEGQEILQFHGKWPFKRILGIQEPALVVFSLGNWYVSYLGMLRLWNAYKHARTTDYGASVILLNAWIVACVSSVAWICSTIFHTRDYLFTEHMDYYFAGLTVLSSFHAGFIRVLNLQEPCRKWIRLLFTFSCVLAYSYHLRRLLTDWLYSYNMQANVTVGIMHSFSMIGMCVNLHLQHKKAQQESETALLSHFNYITPSRVLFSSKFIKSSSAYSLYPLLLSAIVSCGMLLEIFDFPPVMDLFDAHSLWHLATIIPPFMGWYDWIVWDAFENVGAKMIAETTKKNA